jgi:nitrous oxidase accessory protein
MAHKFIILLSFSTLAIRPLAANTIIVGPSLSIKTVKQAMKLARNGDTVLVKHAHYAVANQIIDKSITLIGENYPVLDGQMKGDILIIEAGDVVVKGFMICNTNRGALKNYSGIRCEQVKNITIENNRINNALFSIYLPKTHHGLIKDNLITGKNTPMESGSGIYLWYASNILVQNNGVSGQRDGIYLEFSTGCVVSYNNCEGNYRYGLHFMFSDSNSYTKNIFRNNGAGVAVMYSRHIAMLQNKFENNWGPSAYGLLLKEINDSYIAKNTFTKNTTAIFMESCSRNRFIKNNFDINGWAINLLADCTDNRFNQNNFTGNTFDITTNGSPEQNSFNGNYWDKYSGYDINKDGRGDIPYYPVSLYSKVVENIPYAIVLFHSLIVNLIDKAEHSIPSLTPVSVVDRRPLMKYHRS